MEKGTSCDLIDVLFKGEVVSKITPRLRLCVEGDRVDLLMDEAAVVSGFDEGFWASGNGLVSGIWPASRI